ncbi:MAG: hypothetical protein HOV84_17435 [Streptomyces sp.]|nr:hypothetical protein [Streptomyces sp.]
MRRINVDGVAQLVTAALIVHAYLAEHPEARAAIWLRVQKSAAWSAMKLGRLAMTAELAYRREVMH